MTDRNTYDDFAEQYSAMVADVDVGRDPLNREHWNTIPFLMVLEFVKTHP